uniref:RING-type domain-containing protein n=1 Tax=Macaca mulatta TaxID=9544 RepID=A0A5F7ZYA5_MACMU|nr:E3 ubiquitin-protein ligase ARIH2 isoform X1 [Macaca mulatta]
MSHSAPEPPLKFVQGKDEITDTGLRKEPGIPRTWVSQNPRHPGPRRQELGDQERVVRGDEYDGVDRVEMSCGHAVDPENLKLWCLQLIKQGKYTLHCPAEVKGKKCGAQWLYPEVRRCTQLSDSEQQEFEQGLAQAAMRRYCNLKVCPGCRSLVERKDPAELRVHCTVCCTIRGVPYDFCWQCMQAWKGPMLSSNRCGNEDCRDPILHILATCATKDLPDSSIQGCPSIRACPECGLLIEHKERCKYVTCSRCDTKFCFACLETAQACEAAKPASWFKRCAKPLAPRQSHVPVWSPYQQRLLLQGQPLELEAFRPRAVFAQQPAANEGRCLIL